MHKYFQRQVHPVPGLSILRHDLCRILGPRDNDHSKYFSRETLGNDTLLLIKDSLAQASSFTKIHMEDLSALDTLDIHQITAKDASYLLWVDYSFKEEQNPRHTGCTIYIAGKIPTKESDKNFTEPHFVMTGYSHITNGMDVFLPHEILCRAGFSEGTDRTFLGAAFDPKAAIAGLCYAEQAFQDVAAGLPLDMRLNQSWLEEQNRQAALERFKNLLTCTDEERQMELAQKKITKLPTVSATNQPSMQYLN